MLALPVADGVSTAASFFFLYHLLMALTTHTSSSIDPRGIETIRRILNHMGRAFFLDDEVGADAVPFFFFFNNENIVLEFKI
jgi:hypothetical protein